MSHITKPPMQGTEQSWYDGRYRIWTIDNVPFGYFPGYPTGPAMVTHTEWGVSFPRLCKAMSSADVVAADDGKITLSVSRVVSESPYKAERHPLDDTKYDTDEDARRASYEAGVTAYMVYVKDEARYGL